MYILILTVFVVVVVVFIMSAALCLCVCPTTVCHASGAKLCNPSLRIAALFGGGELQQSQQFRPATAIGMATCVSEIVMPERVFNTNAENDTV